MPDLKVNYFPDFLAAFACFFSFGDLAGFFLVSFFLSIDFDMALRLLVLPKIEKSYCKAILWKITRQQVRSDSKGLELREPTDVGISETIGFMK